MGDVIFLVRLQVKFPVWSFLGEKGLTNASLSWYLENGPLFCCNGLPRVNVAVLINFVFLSTRYVIGCEQSLGRDWGPVLLNACAWRRTKYLRGSWEVYWWKSIADPHCDTTWKSWVQILWNGILKWSCVSCSWTLVFREVNSWRVRGDYSIL